MGRSLLLECLGDALDGYGAIIAIDRVAKEGDEAKALLVLSDIAALAAAKIPELRGVIASVERAQRQAAEAHDLAQRMPQPRVICAAVAGVAPPQSDPANPQSQAPSEPGPSIA